MPDTNTSSTPRPQAPATRPRVETLPRIVDKINASDSILVALSDNPSVDELTAAIALTMLLDRINKHATAIFSGEIPNTLEFLRPEDTLEKNTDSLQDFIIALNKEKADHIRYMIEGDFVRIYITPYHTTIDEKDLEFSHGDFNVDLVITFNVKNSEDLDDALSEYARIAHDATAINISNSIPGHFAEIEWTNPEASSACEMVIDLAEQLGVTEFDQDIATALLTGIVSATERFSNTHTTPNSLTIASKLMSSGADQQLISSNIIQATTKPPEPEPVVEEPQPKETPPEKPKVDDPIPTPASVTLPEEQPTSAPTINPILQAASTTVAAPITTEPTPPIAATPIVSSQTTPATSPTPIVSTAQQSSPSPSLNPAAQAAPSLAPLPDVISLPQLDYEPLPAPNTSQSIEQQIQPVLTPPDYGAMIDAELSATNTPAPRPAPAPAPTPTPTPAPTIAPAPQPTISQPTPEPIQSAPIPEQIQPTPEPIQPAPIPEQIQPTPEPIQPATEPIPLPPLPMPPAPQPLSPEPFQPTPQPVQTISPQPMIQPTLAPTPESVQSTTPATPTAPTMAPRPMTPQATPGPIDNASFQIPNFPQ